MCDAGSSPTSTVARPTCPQLGDIGGDLSADATREWRAFHEDCRHRGGTLVTWSRSRPSFRRRRPAHARRVRQRDPRGGRPPEEVIVVTEGGGPAAARNDGVDDATGDVVVFVDADVLPHRTRSPAPSRLRGRIRRWLRSSAPTTTCRRSQASSRSFGTSCTTTFTSRAPARRRRSGPASGRSAPTRFRGAAGSTPTATRAFGRGHRPRHRLTRAGQIPLDPQLQGTHLKAWTLRRWCAPTCGGAACRGSRSVRAPEHSRDAQPRLATPSERGRRAADGVAAAHALAGPRIGGRRGPRPPGRASHVLLSSPPGPARCYLRAARPAPHHAPAASAARSSALAAMAALPRLRRLRAIARRLGERDLGELVDAPPPSRVRRPRCSPTRRRTSVPSTRFSVARIAVHIEWSWLL